MKVAKILQDHFTAQETHKLPTLEGDNEGAPSGTLERQIKTA